MEIEKASTGEEYKYKKIVTEYDKELEMLEIYNRKSHENHTFVRKDDDLIMKYTKYAWGLLIVFFFSPSVSAQSTDCTAKYHIRVLGMNIGEFTVNQKTVDKDISIQAITDVEVKIIFTYRVKYIQQSLYRQGSLWNSQVQTIKNGKVNSDIRLEKQGETYLLINDGDTTLIHDNITYSGSLLYFNEPKQVSYLYKERTGEKKPVKRIADHTYVITNEKDSKTNEYEYKDGILVRAALIHPLAVIHLERSM
ncbi:MAG: DUF6134 family protein [Mangrovibacterium sp.]